MKAAKRAAALLCAALLLSLTGGVFAADAGSAQDPILSKSYVQQSIINIIWCNKNLVRLFLNKNLVNLINKMDHLNAGHDQKIK